MPIFDQVELFLGSGYSGDEQKNFIFRSRCICNYLERGLVEKKFETTLSRLNIHCSKDESEVRVIPLKGAPYLEVCIKYDLPALLDLDESLLQRCFMQIIDFGLKAAENFMPIPYVYCMEILRRFEENGFKNEWLQAKKSWAGGQCEVMAQLTMEKFTLWQSICIGGVIVANRQIVETKPREMLFIDYLGTLSLDRSGNILYKRRGKLVTKFDIKVGEFCEVGPLKT